MAYKEIVDAPELMERFSKLDPELGVWYGLVHALKYNNLVKEELDFTAIRLTEDNRLQLRVVWG